MTKIRKNKELRNNIHNINKAIQWIDTHSTNSISTFITYYIDENYQKIIIYLDNDMSSIELEQERTELIHKKEKYSIAKYQNDEYIRAGRRKKKTFTGPIIRDYTKYKDLLFFYNYLCSIEIKESRTLNYDSDSN